MTQRSIPLSLISNGSIAMLALFLLISSIFGGLSARSTVARLDQQASLFEAIGRLQGLKLTILDADLALNRYMSSADDQLLGNFTQLVKTAKVELDEISAKADEQTPKARADVTSAFEAWSAAASESAKNLSATSELATSIAVRNRQIDASFSAVSAEFENLRQASIQALSQSATFQYIILAVSLVLSVATFWLNFRILLTPFRQQIERTKALASGSIEAASGNDCLVSELNDLSSALTVFRNNANERQRLQEASSRDAATKFARQEEVERLIGEFQATVATMLATLGACAQQGRQSAEALSQASGMADVQAGQASVASHQISSNSMQISSAIEELAASVAEVARQTETTHAKVNAMAAAALQTETTIRAMQQAAETIGSVTGMIKAVSEQTNLLALNATVEAARAGAAGKGFTIVAQEVKGLANQTSRSTDEIGQLVAAMQQKTGQAVAAVSTMAGLTRDAQTATAAITSAIQQQQIVSIEISRSIAQTSQGSSELAVNIDGVSHVIKEANQSAKEALKSSDELAANASDLRRSVDTFLSRVKVV